MSEISIPQAWVVFSGQSELFWVRLLKPGFRHCYVLLNDGMKWTSVDPLSPRTEVAVHHHVPPSFDLPGWLSERGQKVVAAPIERTKNPAPFMPFSCVEAVKRILGIHCRRILTPWQLYKFLQRSQTWEVLPA